MEKEENLIKEQLSFDEVLNIFKNYDTPVGSEKNNNASDRARQEGNDLYKKKEHTIKLDEEVWMKYCMSISTAVIGSEKEALGYYNRSTYLSHVFQHKEALEDAERALKIAKTNESKFKFLCRKVKCLAHINKKSAEKVFQEAKACLNEIEDKAAFVKILKDTEESLSKTKAKDKVHDADRPKLKKKTDDFSSITMRHNVQFGKYPVASRDIEAGEVIFIEKPYITSLNHEVFYAYCNFCSTRCWNMIPCDSCSWSMYCTEKCKQDAWAEFHDIECSCFSNIIKLDLPGNIIEHVAIALKFIIMEYKKAGSSIANLREIVLSALKENEDNPLCNFVTDKRVTNKGIKSVLCFNEFRTHETILNSFARVSIHVLFALAKFTELFGKKFHSDESNNLQENEDILFIGSLIFKFLIMFYYYGSAVCRMSTFVMYNKDQAEKPLLKRGHCISTIIKTMRHDCNPNVDKCFTNDNRVVAYALRPIKKNEQLLCSVFSDFARVSRVGRMEHFTCRFMNRLCLCQACNENWKPLIKTYSFLVQLDEDEAVHALLTEPRELELYAEQKPAIRNLMENNDSFEYSKKMLRDISVTLTTAINEFKQPSLIICLLTEALRAGFEKLYFKYVWIPNCNKNSGS